MFKKEDYIMNENQVKNTLRNLGYTFISDNRHIKCKDQDGNILVMSKKYLDRATDNPRFLNTLRSRRCLYFKNKPVNYQMKGA